MRQASYFVILIINKFLLLCSLLVLSTQVKLPEGCMFVAKCSIQGSINRIISALYCSKWPEHSVIHKQLQRYFYKGRTHMLIL